MIMLLIIILLMKQVQFVFTPIVIFVKTLFIPFLISGILFYLCRPLLHLLQKWKVPKKLGILIIFVVLLIILSLILRLIVPVIQDQIARLIDNIPDMVSGAKNAIDYWQAHQKDIPNFVQELIQKVIKLTKDNALSTTSSLAKGITGVFSTVFSLAVVPFILFYMLSDSNKFVPNFERLLPTKKTKEIRSIFSDMDKALASYIQGQLIVSSVVGVLLLIGYLIIGLDYGLLLALFGMATNVIPFLGPFIAATPAVIVGYFQDPMMAIYVIVVMVIAQQIESNLVSPNVMGKALNVHPLTIILLILVGGNLAGVLGMILIIPTYAVLKVVLSHIYRLFLIRK